MPEYDYIYLGDNARTPYGPRSFEVVYEFTLQAVKKLFDLGCPLVILACNTASAKALRTIQQTNLPSIDPTRRVLGVIRPTVECIGELTQSRHIGLLATTGTIKSESYLLEIQKLFPDISVIGEACPMWVPLVENNEYHSQGADYFVQKHIQQLLKKDPQIDTIILGCTHYPLIRSTLGRIMGENVTLVNPAYETTQELKKLLAEKGLLNEESPKLGENRYQFYFSDGAEKFKRFANSIIKYGILSAKTINIEEY